MPLPLVPSTIRVTSRRFSKDRSADHDRCRMVCGLCCRRIPGSKLRSARSPADAKGTVASYRAARVCDRRELSPG